MATFGQGVQTEIKTFSATINAVTGNTTIYTVPAGRFAYISFGSFGSGGSSHFLERVVTESQNGGGGSLSVATDVNSKSKACMFSTDDTERCMGPGDTVRFRTSSATESTYFLQVIEYF